MANGPLLDSHMFQQACDPVQAGADEVPMSYPLINAGRSSMLVLVLDWSQCLSSQSGTVDHLRSPFGDS